MKKSYIIFIVLFFFLTTYTPKFDTQISSKINIKKIEIKNIRFLEASKIIKKLSFLYKKNLFILDTKEIERVLNKEAFVESFTIKKIFPNTIRINILEKKPIAVLLNKKKKFYISDKGRVIDFIAFEKNSDLPLVFGGGKNFLKLYQNLIGMNFPFRNIKSFHFFEIGRWDLILKDDKVIKLPVNNYLLSLESFMQSISKSNFDNYVIFDYRIKDQLILN